MENKFNPNPKTSAKEAIWLGNDGPWLNASIYYKIDNQVWVRTSSTQEQYIGDFNAWKKDTIVKLMKRQCFFRGSPTSDINPWSKEEHELLRHNGTLPENPWGRRID